MKTAAIRAAFFDYFKSKDHQWLESSSLVPGNDPTLLFTNAGMVQFKDLFLGRERRAYTRAVTSQRCVRAGGKHNDLENVGYTARHHTFFEMLGNFSFGDYFKHDAIFFGWDFLTRVLKLPPERLWVTVFDEDDEAANIWINEIKVDPARVTRIGAKDNFWSMGDTGPCGPCSEIFFDHGPDVAGGPPGSPDADGDRYVEIWNLVFMQFDRASDGTLTPLPKPSVDTGMGLERLAAVMQGVHSNYHIDLFRALTRAAAEAVGVPHMEQVSLRVIADHIRSCSFLIADGVLPSNEGRGYVLRRIIRRAIRHGYELGKKTAFFHKLVQPLCDEMGEAYPGLVAAKDNIARVLLLEEQRFAETLEQGMKMLNEAFANISGGVIPGETVFKLYDTYGFPVDLTADIALQRNIKLDMDGFEREMAAQRDRARAASQFGVEYAHAINVQGRSEFTGYEHLSGQSKVLAIVSEGKEVSELGIGQLGLLVLDATPFYAESGGQVGDHGVLKNAEVEFEVQDTQKQGADLIGHIGVVRRGTLRNGMAVQAHVNESERQDIASHHSATHLLHAALRKVLGAHVQQKGSKVDVNRLRFDFSHNEPVRAEEMKAIERLVNAQVRANNAVDTRLMAIADAQKSGAMALFDEKYGETVRVLSMGDFSVELCGGTHVQRTGDIGLVRLVAEGGVSAGVRRIEGVAGRAALEWVDDSEARLARLADITKGSRDNVEEKVAQLVERARTVERELERLKAKLASSAGDEITARAVDVKGVKVIAARLDGVDAKALRDTVDQLKNKLGNAAIVLAAVEDGKVRLAAGVTAQTMTRVKAGELVNMVALQVGGKGGGRPDMAQAGGTDPSGLDGALASVAAWVGDQLA